MAKKAIDKINEKTDNPVKVVEREVKLNDAFVQVCLRNKPGKPNIYTPQELFDKAVEYVEWNAKNPLFEQKAFGTGMIANMPKMRAMTVSGFCVFANISSITFYDYEKRNDEYANIVTRVKEMFRSQKIEGAAAGLLDSNIIARELGLSDKQEIKNDTQVTVNITLPDNGKGFKKELP
jgi:hypothetical protein